jgi:hypothetical protein
MICGISIPFGKHVILDIRRCCISFGIAQTGGDARGFLIGDIAQGREIQSAQIWNRYLGKLHRHVSATAVIRIFISPLIELAMVRTAPVFIIVPCRTHPAVGSRIPGSVFRYHRKADVYLARAEYRGSLVSILTEYQYAFVPISLVQLHILGRGRRRRCIPRLRHELQLQLAGFSHDIIILKRSQRQALPYPVLIGRVVGIRKIHHLGILRRFQLILSASLHEIETSGIIRHQILAADRHTEISAPALGFLLCQQSHLRQSDAHRAGIIIRICHAGNSHIQLRSVLHDTKLERHLIETNLIIHAALGDGRRTGGRNHTDGMFAHTQRDVTELGTVS